MASSLNIALIAPSQLQDAFSVLFESTPGMRLSIYANTFEALFAEAYNAIPNVILTYIDDKESGATSGQVSVAQIGEIKAAWPNITCIALVDDPQHQEQVREMGADLVLLKGVSANQLLKALETLGGKTSIDQVSTVQNHS